MTLLCDDVLNDDGWHTVHVHRRANYLEGWVDQCLPVTGERSIPALVKPSVRSAEQFYKNVTPFLFCWLVNSAV